MKIEIKNFGPIGNLCFDINKDLNLIYGDNAIGKSYATYCLYSILKNVKNKSLYRIRYTPDVRNSLTLMVKKFKNLKVNEEVKIDEEINSFIEQLLKFIYLENVQNSLLNTFSSLKNLKNRYTNKDFEINLLVDANTKISFFNSKNGLDLKYSNTSTLDYSIILKNTKSTRYTLNSKGKKVIGQPFEEDFTREFSGYILNLVNTLLINVDSNIRDIYYLPASRSGLYQALNAFTPIVAELTQNRFFIQNKSIELPSLSEPLSDYFIDISTLDKKHINKDYNEIIESLEKDILKGVVEYNDKSKKITYIQSKINLELNLSETSSMVSELSPLVLYFKHILNNKYSSNNNSDPFIYDHYYSNRRRATYRKDYDIIFIEEPEAHLHPEVQIKIIELFAKLHKYRLKVFITSHSNYMFNKLNNIILNKEIDSSMIEVYHLIKSKEGDTINGEMHVSQDGINDDNFQDVSERLYNERLEIFDKQND